MFCLLLPLSALAVAPESYLTLEQVKQCLRAQRQVKLQHETMVREKAQLEAVSARFRAEAGELRRTLAQFEARRKAQAAAEAASGGIRTGRNLGDADLAAIDAELEAVRRRRLEQEQAVASYNRALADHNRRFALHYARLEELNRRLDRLREYTDMTNARCSRTHIWQRDLAAAQAAIATEDAAR